MDAIRVTHDSIRAKAEEMINQAEEKAYMVRVKRLAEERLAKIPDTVEAVKEAIERVKNEAQSLTNLREERRRLLEEYQENLDRSRSLAEEKQNLLTVLKQVAEERQTPSEISEPLFQTLQDEIEKIETPKFPSWPSIDFKFSESVLSVCQTALEERLMKANEVRWGSIYRKYAEEHGISTDLDFENLVLQCNDHHNHELLRDRKILECNCGVSPPEPGQETCYGEHVPKYYGPMPDHYFRFGTCWCNFGTRLELVSDPSKMGLGFIESTKPVWRLQKPLL